MSASRTFCALPYIFILCLGVALSGCSTLPSQENRSASVAFGDTGNTRLGKAVTPRVGANPGYSGVHPLAGHDAFAARLLLMSVAERSLDVQYYIWNKDMTGTLLFNGLYEAAERGVRVRLLLDDGNTSGLDPILAALDAHPNIEVRLFNPFVVRGVRLLNFFDFSRLNRRMHNKSFTADNEVTIVGGRNVGDQYFGAPGGVMFVDVDVLAVGPVVKAVSNIFDQYWASESSYPVERLLPKADSDAFAELASAISRVQNAPATEEYVSAVRDSSLIRELVAGQLSLEWAATRVISDDPAKGLGLAAPEALMLHKLKQVIGTPSSELNLVSPYFVPGAAAVAAFTALAKQGVQIRVLTNSLEATDVVSVYAGYAKSRKPLLQAGVQLYEIPRLLPDAVRQFKSDGRKPSGSSKSGLHAKTFSVDQARIFVGSFNLDPRSEKLNTEMGFIIESPTLARRISHTFLHTVPDNTYQLGLSDSGHLYWIKRLKEGGQLQYEVSPGTTFLQRAGVWFISLLPIDWLL